jgi:uncharacterized protein YggE
MTTTLRHAALTCLLTVVTSPAAAQSTPTISITGDAEIRVVPDEVVLSLGVETFDRVLKTARTDNDERVRRAIAVAKAHGVAGDRIQTDYIGIEPRHRSSEVAFELLGYAVRKTIVIRLRDVAKFEALLADALDAGVTHVHGIEFRSTDLRRHRDQARSLAMKAAREKAELLAREAGRSLGPVQSIGDASFGYWSGYGSGWGSRFQMSAQNVSQQLGGAPLELDSTLAPGQISIRASVHAVFVLQ